MKKLLFSIMIFAVIWGCCGSVSFCGTEVEPGDIYVSDPLTTYLISGEPSFLAANIKNYQSNTKIYVSVSRFFPVVVDEAVLKQELPVSMLMLIAPEKLPSDRRVVFSVNAYQSETDENRVSELRETLEKYFDAKSSIQSLKDPVPSLREEYSYWRTRYQLLFEKRIFLDAVQSPSYYTSLSNLEAGSYIVRFLGADGSLIKEFSFEVVRSVEDIPLSPAVWK